MTVFQRIQGLCTRNGITISALENKLGFSHYSLTEVKAVNIRSDRLLQIAQYFDVSTDWLLTGEEHGKKAIALSDEEEILVKLFRNLDDVGKKLLLKQYSILSDAGLTKKSADFSEVKEG